MELDTDEELILGFNLFKVEEEDCICNDGKKVKIVGKVESIDEDGCMVVKVKTSVLMFVTTSAGIVPGLVVKILLNQIKVYPMNIR